jgi:transcriptional regulator with XRE-family HTH domain
VTSSDAGAALRRWRERNGLKLLHIASRTGLDITQLSYLERGIRKPQRRSIEKLETGMGWRPGFFQELSAIPDEPDTLDRMLDEIHETPQRTRKASARVSETGVLEDYAKSSIENLNTLIHQLPAPDTPRFSRIVAAALGQCGKDEILAADSWRISALTERDTAGRLLDMLATLENTRIDLLNRLPDSACARFDQACRRSGWPEAVIAALTGLSPDEIWQVRCGAAVPEGKNARVAAFIKALKPPEDGKDGP